MARFWTGLIPFLFVLGICQPVFAQKSLADLAKIADPVSLDWRNPNFGYTFHLPPTPGPASLTLKAKPGATPPVPGSYFLLSINQHPSLSFAPIAEGFTARFDIPASQLQSGRNLIEVSFVSGTKDNCLTVADGGWQLDLQRSRFDLALARPTPSLIEIEPWLAADIGAPQKIAIRQGELSFAAYSEFGALIVQGLGLRMKALPQIISNEREADLIITANLGGASLISMDATSAIPTLVFSAFNAYQLSQTVRWFAENRLPKEPHTAPVTTWPLEPLPLVNPLMQLVKNAIEPAWEVSNRPIAIRLPKAARARLLIDMHRPTQADRTSKLHVLFNGQEIAAPSLWRRVNSVAVDLPATQSNAHELAILPKYQPTTPSGSCAEADWQTPKNTTRITLQLASNSVISELDRLAWNGGVVTKAHGQEVQIILPSTPGAALNESWRTLAHIAKIGGQAISRASYGGNILPNKHLLVIAPRADLPRQLVQVLPTSFARGAGRAPGDPYPKYKRLQLIESAYAAQGAQIPIGIAGSAIHSNGRVWLAFSADDNQELAAALHNLTQTNALDKFNGTVVRWRGGKVEVNATTSIGSTSLTTSFPALWQIFMLILVPTGIWSILYLSFRQKFR